MPPAESPPMSTFDRAPVPQAKGVAGLWTFAALLVALLGVTGSLFLSIGMGLRACPLCFYQRTFMMGLVGVLVMGILAGTGHGGRLALVSLPLAIAGLGVALFHVFLEVTGTLECPHGVLDIGSAPQQSLTLFLVLCGLLLADVYHGR